MSNKFKVFLVALFSFAAIGAFSSIKYVANTLSTNQHMATMSTHRNDSTNHMKNRMIESDTKDKYQHMSSKQGCH